MPQLDPQTLVRSSSESKIAPVTLRLDTDSSSSPPPPDYPVESFYLSKEDELEWFDRNTAFYERNESTKGNSHPISTSQRYTSSSSAFNLKSKAAIILGLPKNKTTNYTDCKFRRNCKHVNTARFFPKRSRSSGKSTLPLSEPGSPKVSCIGRVKSKRDGRSRRIRQQTKPKTPIDINTTEPVRTPTVRPGFWKTLKSAFGGGGRRKTRAVDEDTPPTTTSRIATKEKSAFVVTELVADPTLPPGLGGLKRFASGRRTESWDGGDDDDVELDVGSESDSSDHGSVWRRRCVGPMTWMLTWISTSTWLLNMFTKPVCLARPYFDLPLEIASSLHKNIVL